MHLTAANFTEKVFGGVPTLQGEIPHQVLIKYYDEPLCGGSILATYLILTAAHCLTNRDYKSFEVVAGENVLSHRSGAEQSRKVKSAIVHPLFEHRAADLSKGYDIALLVLDTELVFNEIVHSVLIPSPRNSFTELAVVSGWGRSPETDPIGSSNVLRKVNVKIHTSSVCKSEIDHYLEDLMICAGDYGKDACRGDSGGPLTCLDNTINHKEYVCGIVSHGVLCDPTIKEDMFGVYTNVVFFQEWIISETVNIRPEYACPSKYFRCKNFMCIPDKMKCDGVNDCFDESDENNCSASAKFKRLEAVALDAFYNWKQKKLP